MPVIIIHLLCFIIYDISVCNEVPEQPVLSPVSGSIFEKRLIEKYITENGVDPINGKELTIEQLITITSNNNSINYLSKKKKS